jgi:hypothetical protein
MDSCDDPVGHRLDRPTSNLHNRDWLARRYGTNPEMLDLIVARPIVGETPRGFGEARHGGNDS